MPGLPIITRLRGEGMGGSWLSGYALMSALTSETPRRFYRPSGVLHAVHAGFFEELTLRSQNAGCFERRVSRMSWLAQRKPKAQ